MSTKSLASTILMVRPSCFGYNEQTASTNAFQSEVQLGANDIADLALAEFDFAVEALKRRGVDVLVALDSEEPKKPDAIFPNNWFSTHADGVLVTYPMFAPNRRVERQQHIIELLQQTIHVRTHLRLESYEAHDIYLEGTGSIILDRQNKIAYASKSPRTQEPAFTHFCDATNHYGVLFNAVDAHGQDIYHTNVLMAMGLDFVVICMDAIPAVQQPRLRQQFAETGKTIIDITHEQVEAYAGNMLQVQTKKGEPVLIMSEQARKSLRADQILTLEKHTSILAIPINTIELIGGGSIRCMMAEIMPPFAG